MSRTTYTHLSQCQQIIIARFLLPPRLERYRYKSEKAYLKATQAAHEARVDGIAFVSAYAIERDDDQEKLGYLRALTHRALWQRLILTPHLKVEWGGVAESESCSRQELLRRVLHAIRITLPADRRFFTCCGQREVGTYAGYKVMFGARLARKYKKQLGW